jgi:hypothetical protein
MTREQKEKKKKGYHWCLQLKFWLFVDDDVDDCL